MANFQIHRSKSFKAISKHLTMSPNLLGSPHQLYMWCFIDLGYAFYEGRCKM